MGKRDKTENATEKAELEDQELDEVQGGATTLSTSSTSSTSTRTATDTTLKTRFSKDLTPP